MDKSMTDNITIDPVRPEEVDIICDIAVQAWEPLYDSVRRTVGDRMFKSAWPDSSKSKATQVRNACRDTDPATVLVAKKDGKIAGFITYDINRDTRMGTIGNNAVQKDFRGMGIGNRMYERVLKDMKAAGMSFATVVTGDEKTYAAARHAYEKAGFNISISSITYYRTL